LLRWMRVHLKFIMITVIVLFVISCFALYGIGGGSRRGGSSSNNSKSDTAVAEINGDEVMRSDVEKVAMQIAENQKQSVTSLDMPQFRKMALDNMVMQKELEKEIESRDIDVKDDEIDAEYERQMNSFPTREEFNNALQRAGTTEKEVKENIKKQLGEQKIIDSISADLVVSDATAKTFYDRSKTYMFKQPAGFKTLVVTFKSKPAAELAQKAIAGGAKWDNIMNEQKADIETSTTTAKPAFLTEDMMKNAPLSALKNLPLNKVSQVISIPNTTKCFFAMKLSKESARTLDFNEVSADVKNFLKTQESQIAVRKFFKQLRDRAQVKILDPSFFPATSPITISSDKKTNNSK
jgi:hypothetical protein